MNKCDYPGLDETLYTQRLANGLQVLVVPKPGFTRKMAYLVTDFGSVHRDFILDGQAHTTPAGIAHYLEHKIFDMPGRDVSEEFSALGASVNAFTSFDLTAYYFSCTEHFEESLRLLLEFVSTPYFTEESVQKEQGIIDQEIDMNLDDAGTQVFENLMRAMYDSHPIRVPILGDRDSIRDITPQKLTLVHRAFYTPGNMVLCVVGDVEPEGVCALAEAVMGKLPGSMGEKLPLPDEPMTCPAPLVRATMDIAMPTFCLGFKCPDPGKGEAAIRREIIGDLAAEALFGESSQLFLQLYEQGLIDSSFGGGFECVDGGAMLTCGGDSEDALAVRDAILARARSLCREGIDEKTLLRMKRSALGRRLRDLDSFDSTCFRLCAYYLSDFDYFRFPELYDSIREQELLEFLADTVTPQRCSLSIIDIPKEEPHEP